MCTYCQGVRRVPFLLLLLIFSAYLGSAPSVAMEQEAGPSAIVVSPSDANFVPTFQKHDSPVFSGEFIASDPAIVAEDGFYRMFYTCFIVPASGFVPENVRAGICSATSIDGLRWSEVETHGSTHGLVLAGRKGSWEENLEASFAVKIDGVYLLYYAGYQQQGNPAPGFPAQLSVATSTDAVHFSRLSNDPILAPTPGWYDNDAVYSPAVAISGDQLVMVYAGHCYTNCPLGYGVTLLGATSVDGLNWDKLDEPVLQGPSLGLNWTADGVAEPALLYGSDDRWHLFFTSLQGDLRELGLASGTSPFGPWEVLDQPILEPTAGSFDEGGVLAPFVLIEDDVVRMWYLGQSFGEQTFAIGYAEASLPVDEST